MEIFCLALNYRENVFSHFSVKTAWFANNKVCKQSGSQTKKTVPREKKRNVENVRKK
jgi:hypothetical protein